MMYLDQQIFDVEFRSALHKLRLSQHAKKRMAQRNLTLAEVLTVLKYGKYYFQNNGIEVFFGKNQIPSQLQSHARLNQLNGTTVILSETSQDPMVDYTIITVIRNRQGMWNRRKRRKAN